MKVTTGMMPIKLGVQFFLKALQDPEVKHTNMFLCHNGKVKVIRVYYKRDEIRRPALRLG